MNAPTNTQPPAMQAMLDEMLRIAGTTRTVPV